MLNKTSEIKLTHKLVFSSLWAEKMQFTRKMQLYINIYETKKVKQHQWGFIYVWGNKNNTELDYLINY